MPVTLEREGIVAKDKPSTDPTETVRLPSRLVQLARVTCLHAVGGKKKLTAYLETMVSDQIVKDYEETMRRIKGEPPAKPKKGA